MTIKIDLHMHTCVSKDSAIHPADVVPTLCTLFTVPPPAQSQGAVAYDLFEGHEMESLG